MRAQYLPSWMQSQAATSDATGQRTHAAEASSGPKGPQGEALAPSEGARNLGAWIGYRRFVDGLQCYCLLRGKQAGNLWVMWLKDHFTEYEPLVDYWVGILARMALRHAVTFDVVTCPPSSGKRDYYLAGRLAREVAAWLDVPFEQCFFNPDPRGHRASVQEKLREADGPGAARYEYSREPDGENVLIVDDAMCTRQTALRCVDAAHLAAQEVGADPDRLFFVVIYS